MCLSVNVTLVTTTRLVFLVPWYVHVFMMIKRGIRIVFFALSLFFLGMHSLLPHNHDQPELHDHAALPTWVDFLADLINSNDLGVEHLEDFRIQESTIKFSSLPFFFFNIWAEDPSTIFLAEVSAHARVLPTYADQPLVSIWGVATFFRGPPVA